jgi:CRP/FNR family transcriptional regulator, anaerobic regulatory protein
VSITSLNPIFQSSLAKPNGDAAAYRSDYAQNMKKRNAIEDSKYGRERRIGAKEHLFTEGDAKTHMYRVTSGAVCRYRMLGDGRRQIIDFSFEGDVIGLSSERLEACNAQAMVSTRLRCYPIAVLLRAAKQDGTIALQLYEALSREVVASREHLQCVGQRGATERLATFLVILSRRNEIRGSDPETLQLPMTRVDIADFLGIKIETVSRTFSKLKAEGLIEIDEATTIRVKDPKKLERLAQGHVRV